MHSMLAFCQIQCMDGLYIEALDCVEIERLTQHIGTTAVIWWICLYSW